MPEMLLTDIAVQAKAALSRSRIYSLRKLHVDQDGDSVVLRGRVDSFYHKQLAQELVRVAVDHGAEVTNAISVVYSRERATAEIDW
jgi:trehalose-6-phosphatase